MHTLVVAPAQGRFSETFQRFNKCGLKTTQRSSKIPTEMRKKPEMLSNFLFFFSVFFENERKKNSPAKKTKRKKQIISETKAYPVFLPLNKRARY